MRGQLFSKLHCLYLVAVIGRFHSFENFHELSMYDSFECVVNCILILCTPGRVATTVVVPNGDPNKTIKQLKTDLFSAFHRSISNRCWFSTTLYDFMYKMKNKKCFG